MIEYDRVTANDYCDFTKRMREKLNDGWKCVGGICITEHREKKERHTEYNREYFQAIIRGDKTYEYYIVMAAIVTLAYIIKRILKK